MPTLKKAATREASPDPEWSLPTGIKEKNVNLTWFEIYSQDFDWVHQMRASFLGLPLSTLLTKVHFQNSTR